MQECVLAREGCCFVGECWSEPGRNGSSAWGRDVGMARTLWGHSTSPSYQPTFPAIKFGYCHCRMLDFPPGDLQKSGLFFRKNAPPISHAKLSIPGTPIQAMSHFRAPTCLHGLRLSPAGSGQTRGHLWAGTDCGVAGHGPGLSGDHSPQ